MGFFGANIWKHTFFKSVGALFSSPQRTIQCAMISENGIGSKVMIDLGIGWCSNKAAEMSWLLINKLRMPMEGVEGLVLPVCERSYIPLDPLGRLTPKEREALVSLDQLAEAKWREARAKVAADTNKSPNAELLKTIVIVLFIIILIIVGVLLFKHK